MKKLLLGALSVSLLIWVVACSSENSSEKQDHAEKANIEGDPKEIGQQISTAAQQRLGKQLMQAIEKGGHAYAVSYCRVEANSITDSVAREHNARVSRVSDQRRNPKNAANDQEMEYISYYKQALKNNEDWSPKVISSNDSYTYYTPILTQPLCLNCHGDPETDIKEETLARLQSDYPQDQAVGYGLGEVRGMWKIEWSKD
jgi:hypothetical protein